MIRNSTIAIRFVCQDSPVQAQDDVDKRLDIALFGQAHDKDVVNLAGQLCRMARTDSFK